LEIVPAPSISPIAVKIALITFHGSHATAACRLPLAMAKSSTAENVCQIAGAVTGKFPVGICTYCLWLNTKTFSVHHL
jgi:hypothetical protein